MINNTKAEINLETDRQLFLSIIANLIQNALKYSKENGHISILGKVSAENLALEIEDECGGIEGGILKNLFKPFVSGENSQSGLGLGLTTVQRAVSMLKGEISINNNPGIGCTFLVEIPLRLIPVLNKKIVSGKDSIQPH